MDLRKILPGVDFPIFHELIRKTAWGADYGNITTREAGLLVRAPIKRAEKLMAGRHEA